MTKKIKSMLLATAVGMVAASSQAATYNGDLIVGFTSGSGNDLIFDLGLASSLFNLETWNLGPSGLSLLSSASIPTLNWGVIGDKNVSGTRTAWTTTAVGAPTPLTLANTGAWGNLDTPTASIYQNFTTAGAGQSLSITSTDDNSWNHQMSNPTLTTQYGNAYENPDTLGADSESFYGIAANGSAPALKGQFDLSNSGVLTFNAVPEPASVGLAAGMGLLLLSFRRKFSRKS